MKRRDGRPKIKLRKTVIHRNYTRNAAGSVLIECGNTRVICTASVEEKVPNFLKDKNQGWITSEYGMLPGSTKDRVAREASKGKQSGRTMEIQRLIGRALRSVVDLGALGPRTIWMDCDVIQADGGTRTASVTGAMVALYDAVADLKKRGLLTENPIRDFVAATSVGIINGEVFLDLCYEEDSSADVDMNVIMTGSGEFVEVQATAERVPFAGKDLDKMLDAARAGIKELMRLQKKILKLRK